MTTTATGATPPGPTSPRRTTRSTPARAAWPPVRPDGAPTARWSLRGAILLVASVTLVFALVSMSLGTYALTRSSDARAVVLDEVQPALAAGTDLSAALLDQETGIRGYSLTGREEFSTPYLQGQQDQQRAATALRGLAGAGHLAALLDDLDRVEADARAWRDGFAEPTRVAITEAGGPVTPIDPAVGKATFDVVRSDLAALDAGLRQVQADATRQLRSAATFLRVVFAAIGTGLALLILAIGIWLRRSVIVPVSRLAQETRLVVAGDAHREVRGTGPRELVDLGADVDAMRRHILAELDAVEIAHRRLDEQTRELERSNRDLEQFAYVASHDLQEPLRKVSSFCQLLQRRYGGQLDERGESYIAFAVNGAQRMQQLINDLLAFSRVGRLASGFGEVDLNAVAAAAVNQLSTVQEETAATITVDELPTVPGEAPLLTMLLANLVGNALKFRRPGTPPVVTVGAVPADDGWQISVTDNGIGVEPEYADKVFIIFQRLHSREEYPGTGIGLAMAKKIVEYHNGRIWIDSNPEHGATVRFTVPAVDPATEPEGPAQ